MKRELRERIKDFNRRAEAAKRDGYMIVPGGLNRPTMVCDWDGKAWHRCRQICRVEEYPLDGQSPATFRDRNGDLQDFGAAVGLMDDELCETVHSEFVPCTPQEFVEAYAAAHEAEFGEPFAPYEGAAW